MYGTISYIDIYSQRKTVFMSPYVPNMDEYAALQVTIALHDYYSEYTM
jgi:hypothetical protein